MESSNVDSIKSESRAFGSLMTEENTGIQLDEMDEHHVSLLISLTRALILHDEKLLSTIDKDLLLKTIKNYSTELFADAAEGLAIITKQNNLTNLTALDDWLEKEEERCLGFLNSPKIS